MRKILVLAIFGIVHASPSFADTYQELTREVGYPVGAMNSDAIKEISRLDDGSPEVNCLLSQAVRNTDCKQVSTIKMLLDKGALPLETETKVVKKSGLITNGFSCDRGKDLSRAIHNGCAETVTVLVGKMDSSEIDRALGLDSELFVAPKNKGPDETVKDQKNRALMVQIILAIKSRCEHDGPTSSACTQAQKSEDREHAYLASLKRKADAELAARADAEKRDRDSEHAAKEADSSPAALQLRGCEAYGNIKLADQHIAHEREVGQESGYVNKDALHELGQMKVFAKHDLEKVKADYKKRTGTQLDLGKCKTDRNTASE